ncbi:unnamed protein product, partial [Didymodactylos carnosus]
LTKSVSMLKHNYALVKPLLEELMSMGLLIKFNNGVQSGKNKSALLVKEHYEAPTPVTRSAAAKSLTTIKKRQKKNLKMSPNNGTNTILRYFRRITKEINAQSETNGEEPSRQNDDCEIISCLSVHGKLNTNDLIPPINSSSSSIMKTATSSSTELTSKYFRNALVPRPLPRITRLSNGNSTSLQDDKQQQISDKNEQ